MPWLPVGAAALTAVVGIGALALWSLYGWATHHSAGMSRPEATSLHLDTIKTALTVAAGVAAGLTLLLTLRRQSMSERGQHFAEEDAQEQRITALYVAAVEQLGSEKAAVRLGGLYALERLGQDNPKLRQTVVDVICAYLRMPYTPPAEVLHNNAQHSPEYLDTGVQTSDPEQQAERRQELQVRLTAQRLIRDHTRANDTDESAAYWRGPGAPGERMALDLTGAVLVDFDLIECHPGRVTLTRTQFHGDTDLSRAQFHGNADLREAQFHGGTDLGGVQLHRGADLSGAQFYSGTHLGGAQFHRNADLIKVQFHGYTYLGELQFHQDANLIWTQFRGESNLRGAQFRGDANFLELQFHGDAYLNDAQFHEGANLSDAQFHKGANLGNACVSARVTLPAGWTAVPVPGKELLRVEPAHAPTGIPETLREPTPPSRPTHR